MLRWSLAVLLLIAPACGYMGWRTWELLAPQPMVIVAMPRAQQMRVNMADAATHLSQAIRQQTISGAAGAQRSDPEALRRLGEWIAATYPAFHAAAPREPVAGLSYLYTWKGADRFSPPILLYGHLDTSGFEVAGLPMWKAAPFGGHIMKGQVWGRGTQSGKGQLIALMEACEALTRAGFQPRRTVLIALSHDTEAGGKSGAAAIAALLKKRGVKAWFALGEGSAIAAAAPVTGKPTAFIGVTEKRALSLRVAAVTPPGATSEISKAQAVTTLAQALLALDAMPNPASITKEPTITTLRALARDMPLDQAVLVANSWLFAPVLEMRLASSALGEAALASKVEVASLDSAGDAGAASARLTVLLHPADEPAAFLDRARFSLSGLPEVRLEWIDKPGKPPRVSSHESDAYHLIATLARRVAKDANVAPVLYPYATDARHYMDVAGDVYRFTPAVFTAQEEASARGVNERVSIANLDRMIKFYAQLLSEAAG